MLFAYLLSGDQDRSMHNYVIWSFELDIKQSDEAPKQKLKECMHVEARSRVIEESCMQIWSYEEIAAQDEDRAWKSIEEDEANAYKIKDRIQNVKIKTEWCWNSKPRQWRLEAMHASIKRMKMKSKQGSKSKLNAWWIWSNEVKRRSVHVNRQSSKSRMKTKNRSREAKRKLELCMQNKVTRSNTVKTKTTDLSSRVEEQRWMKAWSNPLMRWMVVITS